MNELCISFSDALESHLAQTPYAQQQLQTVLDSTLSFIDAQIQQGLQLPYYPFDDDFNAGAWLVLDKSLDVYICETNEGQALNLEARGKDYATNILSYPSELPTNLLTMMDNAPLGELVICHDVVVREAGEQGKRFEDHLSHLIVHGILHLLGFDHELGQAEQDEMEGFEIAILAELGVSDPYECDDTQPNA